MEFKNPITLKELEDLLTNEATAAEAFEAYYEYVEDSPFAGHYELKNGIEIISGTGVEELEGSLKKGLRNDAIEKANSKARKERDKKYNKVKNGNGRIRIVSEGDSWFQYPRFRIAGVTIVKGVKDVIDHLIDGDEYAVKSLDAGADLLRNIYHKREYIKAIRQEDPRFFLLSAGGNDFFEVFGNMLKKHTSNTPVGDTLMANFKTEMKVLETYYLALLGELHTEFPNLDILIHGYDYLIPKLDGKWIGEPMFKKNILKHQDRVTLIQLIMDEFNAVISGIAANPTFDNKVHYVQVKGTVPQGETWWHDEIHPNKGGFSLVAGKFKDVMQDILANTPIV